MSELVLDLTMPFGTSGHGKMEGSFGSLIASDLSQIVGYFLLCLGVAIQFAQGDKQRVYVATFGGPRIKDESATVCCAGRNNASSGISRTNTFAPSIKEKPGVSDRITGL